VVERVARGREMPRVDVWMDAWIDKTGEGEKGVVELGNGKGKGNGDNKHVQVVQV
jgi:hypothetical protein